MKEKLYCLISIFAVAIFVGGCWVGPPHYLEDLNNGYVVVAPDVMQDACIIRKSLKVSSAGLAGGSSYCVCLWLE